MSNTQAITIDQPRELQAAPVATESNAIISMIERAARDPAVDIDKFERLMAMKERVELDIAKKAFHEAMAAAQAEIPQVVRKAENTHTRSKYATLEAIAKEVTPIVTRHGFNLSFDTADSPLPGHYRLVCQLGHCAGYTREYHADLPADTAGSGGKVNKTAIQGFGSTISYGRRYLTMLIFNVAITNEDNDGNRVSSEPVECIDADQVATIRRLLASISTPEERFLKFIKVDALENIAADRFLDACKILTDKGAKA